MIQARTGAAALALVVGCVDDRGGITGTQSIDIQLVMPTSLGDVDHRLPSAALPMKVDLTAYNAGYEIDATFTRKVYFYVQYLGTLAPLLGPGGTQVETLVTAGKATGITFTLPAVYGPTTLWVDDAKAINPTYDSAGLDPTYATGASPALWFRAPFISDIQRPSDETVGEALTISPLQNKQITINTSRYGERGRLVVTSVFAQGYTVSDVECGDAQGTPPCTTQAYDHVVVFSFSAPRDHRGEVLREGRVIDGFSGAISEFNGLTEINFPATATSSDELNTARLPAPVKLDPATWFNPFPDLNGRINFERNEAAAIEINNAKVCPIDDDFDEFKQWKIDPAGPTGTCGSNVLNVITAGVVGDLDPRTLVGKTLPRVVGVLRPVEIGNFNVWIIFPRSAADLTLPAQ